MAAPAPGSKHHLLCDRTGIALAVTLTGGHCNDVTQLLPLIDGVDPVRGKPRRPRLRAESLIADRGYDHDKYRRALWARGVKPIIARRATEHGSGLGRLRWVVERTFAWLHQFRRLRLRWERLPELHEAFMHLACAFICQRYLRVCKQVLIPSAPQVGESRCSALLPSPVTGTAARGGESVASRDR